MNNKKYKVIKDTREQLGWEFNPSPSCEGMTVATLKTGDYSLEGFEDKFVIERKGDLSEFSMNITQKRFHSELERLESFELPFVILEFTMEDIYKFPQSTQIPPSKYKFIKITPQFIVKALLDIEVQFKTKIILAGKFGREVASSLFKRVCEHYGQT
jgi:ERCC4-type nuclease